MDGPRRSGIDTGAAPFQSGRTAKDARRPRPTGHGKWSARPTSGLEPALVDNGPHTLYALDTHDHRWVQVNVAGPSALLVAKIIKFEERLNDIKTEGKRVKQKDALDMLRLLQAVDTDDLIDGFRRHIADWYAPDVSIHALGFLGKEGTSATSALPEAAAAVDGGNPATAPSFAASA